MFFYKSFRLSAIAQNKSARRTALQQRQKVSDFTPALLLWIIIIILNNGGMPLGFCTTNKKSSWILILQLTTVGGYYSNLKTKSSNVQLKLKRKELVLWSCWSISSLLSKAESNRMLSKPFLSYVNRDQDSLIHAQVNLNFSSYTDSS